KIEVKIQSKINNTSNNKNYSINIDLELINENSKEFNKLYPKNKLLFSSNEVNGFNEVNNQKNELTVNKSEKELNNSIDNFKNKLSFSDNKEDVSVESNNKEYVSNESKKNNVSISIDLKLDKLDNKEKYYSIKNVEDNFDNKITENSNNKILKKEYILTEVIDKTSRMVVNKLEKEVNYIFDDFKDGLIKKNSININIDFEFNKLDEKIKDYVTKIIKVGLDNKLSESFNQKIIKRGNTVDNASHNSKISEDRINSDLDIIKSNVENNSVLDKTIKTDNNILGFIKKSCINPISNLSADEINKLYNDIYLELDKLEEILKNIELPNKETVMKSLETVQNSIKFIGELSNNNYYLQIPINLFGNETTGELYILKKDKNKKKIDPKNVSMLISLDTEKIGQVDSIINVDKKNIIINMMVDKKEAVSFIKNSHQELYSALIEKNYRLVDFKCRLRDEDVDLLNVDKVVKEENDKNKRVSIDYKL
ncbi:MAG: flagellar hook-length control protein FliK, partial [Clostridiales bacterium]